MSLPSPPSPPIKSPYGTFEGTLFQYYRNLVAFETCPTLPYKCILLGGLSDGLIPTPYTKQLQEQCQQEAWSLCQPILSSSYLGFGNGDLNRDTKELDQLLLYLKTHHGATKVALVGHSTGCQNIIHYLKEGNLGGKDLIYMVALQAPVSDRQHAMTESGYQENVSKAREMIQDGKELEFMPRSAFWAPITAKRFCDLQDEGGQDDFFSSDLTDEELTQKLQHVSSCTNNLQSCLVAFSGSDEYVISSEDTKLLTQRLCRAMNGGGNQEIAIPLHMETANHNLSQGKGDAETFVAKVVELLKDIR